MRRAARRRRARRRLRARAGARFRRANQSGSALGPDLRALQNDAFANPGMLWVERGEKL
jgi:hypothetical protein